LGSLEGITGQREEKNKKEKEKEGVFSSVEHTVLSWFSRLFLPPQIFIQPHDVWKPSSWNITSQSIARK
jgi:hypothetical protein